jgi:fumarylacetoacetate (FAA) hydrolase family protein
MNIAVNKVTALSRLAARDYVDLFFLAKAGFAFDELLERAKQKDRGLEEFYLAMALRAVEKIEPADLPKMLKPLDLDELKAYFLALAVTIAQRVKPE